MPRPANPLRVWLLLLGAVLLAGAVHLVGAGAYSPAEMGRALLAGPGDSASQVVLWELRMPRFVAAAFVGGGLGIVGAAFQSLFRNPLADPYILGVSSGAAVGGAIASLAPAAIAFGGLTTFAAAFCTAGIGMAAVVAMARRVAGRVQLASLLLAGVAVGSFLWAAVTLTLVLAGQDSNRVLFWLLGSFSGMTWARLAIIVVVTGLGGFALFRLARRLTVFSTGEEAALRLGIDTERLKRNTLLVGTAVTAVAVSAVGIIGFVGLFVPHIARRLLGPDLRVTLPSSFLLGAGGMGVADLVAQRALGGQEINVGVVTALVGAPFLVTVLRRA